MAYHNLFHRAEVHDVMQRRQVQVRDAVNQVDPSALDDPGLPESLATRYGLDVPKLDESSKYATAREVKVDVSQDPQRLVFDRSTPVLLPATEITIHVPFRGDASLFEVRPSTFSLHLPFGEVESDELRLAFTVIEHRDVTPDYERAIQAVKQHLDWLRQSAAQFERQLQQLAISRIAERRNRIQAQEQTLAKLGIPIRHSETRLARSMSTAPSTPNEKRGKRPGRSEGSWEVFISHASEDKEAIARPLAEVLEARGLAVWYDEFSLKLGDSLRGSIDRGLARSRYGVVILSPRFFEKHWPQQELNGLATREVGGEKVILPIWHNIAFEEVRQSSPTLADRVAISTDEGLDRVVQSVLDAMH
jgi:TIR domain-containing protein